MKRIILVLIAIVSCTVSFAQGSMEEYIEDLRKRVKKGDAEAMYFLGGMYRYENLGMTVMLFQEAAQRGHPMAMKELGDFYFDGGIIDLKPNYEKAVEWYSKSAEKGNVEAMTILGKLYFKGEGVQQNNTYAIEWWKKAAEKGDILAMVNLGSIYYEIKKDYKMAFEWHNKAIEIGGFFDVVSKCYIGQMYYKGEGVQQNYQKAYEFFEAAEILGVAKGFLAEMNYYGYYITKNYDKAYKLAKDGAEDKTNPSGTAMRILSACYRYGMGGAPKDNEKAKYWLDESAKHKDEISMRLLF